MASRALPRRRPRAKPSYNRRGRGPRTRRSPRPVRDCRRARRRRHGRGVSRARHQLERDVAIKVLPTPSQTTRSGSPLPREAHTLAALNHPNIAAIYGIEEERVARVPSGMELVEGEDSPTGSRRRAPLDEALPIAADRRRGRCRARAWHRPSRSQARQHQAARRRHGESARLRPRQDARARAGAWPRRDAVGHDHESGDDEPAWCWARRPT